MRAPYSPSVVVGIDGSRAALDAALWAVDEAVNRDIPLRLVYAIAPCDDSSAGPEDAARRLAAAELSVRHAFTAVESTEKPVKIEVEILQGRPTRALMDASRSAALLCVGSIGLNHFAEGRVGSTAAALASSSRCPIAIIRCQDKKSTAEPRQVVVEVDGAVDSRLLQCGVEEARLRGAPLRVLTTWHSRYTDIHDSRAVAEGNRQLRAQLDGRLAVWKRRNPDLDVKSVVTHGSALHFLAKDAASTQLFVVGRRDWGDISEILGPTGHAALHDTDCSVLVCDGAQSL
jgi:nucleotide-binding universal stress UspA family protein